MHPTPRRVTFAALTTAVIALLAAPLWAHWLAGANPKPAGGEGEEQVIRRHPAEQ